MTMELTPSQLTGASFRTVRKGYDPDEVDALLRDAAAALEQAQQHATAMEARARAAVMKLHERTAEGAAAEPVAAPEPAPEPDRSADRDEVRVDADAAETITRTLLLAQRTADTTIAEAKGEAERIIDAAKTEADQTLDSTRDMSAKLIDEAKAEARKANEAERIAAVEEVESLKARREFLLGDVDQLETFLIDQRERLRGAARQIEEMCERVPSGLGSVKAPILSASDDEPGEDTAEVFMPPETRMPFADVDELARALGDAPLDTGELDVTQAMDEIEPGDPDAPELPIRGDTGNA
jgi:DivIVA domain-containing protein